MLARETNTWPPVRETIVLSRMTGAEVKEMVMLSSHANVAPTEAVPIDPANNVTQTQKVYRAGTILAKITSNVGGGEDESGKWGPYAPAEVDGRQQQAVAYKVTGSTNSAIRWSAKVRGPAGRGIRVSLVDPSGNNQALAVSMTSPFDVVVSLATDGGGAITSTAAQVIAAVNASATAGLVVKAENDGASDGSGVVAAVAATNLVGGQNEVQIAVLPKDVNVHLGDVPTGVFTKNCVFNSAKLIGYTGNEANLDAAFAALNSQVESVTLVAP